MSTTSNDLLQVTLPTVGKPKWKRTFHTEDIKPRSTSQITSFSCSPSSLSPSSTSLQSSSPLSLFKATKKNNIKKPLIQVICDHADVDVDVDIDVDVDNEEEDTKHPIEKPTNESNNTTQPEPTSFLQSLSLPLPSSSCPICNDYEIRYTCPKCNTPFCSVECYRTHDGSCTERFYQSKVNEICHLDVRDERNKSQMKDILTRSHYCDDDDGNDNNSNNNSNSNSSSNKLFQKEDEEMRRGQEGGQNKDTNILSEDELIELATYVLSMKDLNEHDDINDNQNNTNKSAHHGNNDNNDNFDNIPQHLRMKFEQAVQRGDLSHLISQWHPYWLPDHHDHQSSNMIIENVTNDSGETLDERILSIPQLVKPTTTTTSSSPTSKHPVVKLQYNICEVLYHTVYVLRLYNGSCIATTTNNDQNDIILDSATLLYSQSNALSNNKKYLTINEVCMDCTLQRRGGGGNSKSQMNVHNVNGASSIDWKVLLNDLTYICQNKRLVLRVLFDAIDVLNAGIQTLKSNIKSNPKKSSFNARLDEKIGSDGSHDNHIIKQSYQFKKEWKLAKKKLEYYTSWINIHWDRSIHEDIVTDVKDWLNDWILKEDDKEKMKDVTIMGNIHTSTTSSSKKQRSDKVQSAIVAEPEVMLKPMSTKLL